MQGWAIYYSDGSIWEGEDPEYAPARDVQIIVQPCSNSGWAMQHTQDYYVWRDDLNEWRGTDIFGLWDYLMRGGWKKVLFGRTISVDEFNEIFNRAKADRDKRKSSFSRSELSHHLRK